MHTPNEDKMFAGSAAPPRYSAAPPRYSTVAQSHTHAHHHTAPHKVEAEEDEEVIREVDDMTQWIPRPPDRQGIPQYRRLAKPVVIPRVDIASTLKPQLPFMRLYSRDLAPNDIDADGFIAFVDNLVVAQAAPPPLKLVSTAGDIVGLIPSMEAGLAGAGVSILAGTASAVISAKRTRKYLEKVNREYFAPRGLKVGIVKYDEILFRLGVTRDYAPGPFESQTPEASAATLNMRERCMQTLMPYIAPLTSDVPPLLNQRSVVDQISAKMADKERKDRETKSQKKLKKLQDKESEINDLMQQHSAHYQPEYGSDGSQVSSHLSGRSFKDDRRRAKAERKAEKTQEKRQKKAEKKLVKLQGKETKNITENQAKMKKMEFLVVENL